MSWQAVRFAMEQPIEPAGQKLVYLALAFHADATRGRCFPGQQMLARETGQSDRSVRRQLVELERKGYIRRQRRHRVADGSRSSDEYFLVGFQEWAESGDKNPPQVIQKQPAESADTLPDNLSAIPRSYRTIVQPYRTDCPSQPDNLSGDITIREPTSNEPQVIHLDGARSFAPARLFDLWMEWFGTDRGTLAKEHGGGFIWRESNAAQQMFDAGCRSEDDLDDYFHHHAYGSNGEYVPLSPAETYRQWRKDDRSLREG